MASTASLSPAETNKILEFRQVVEVEVKAGLARRWSEEGTAVTEIARLLGVSRNTVYRYLKRRPRPS